MSQVIRPKSTPYNNRSFVIQKKSTISTRQTARSPTKSYNSKSIINNKNKSTQKVDLMSQSIPIQVYFNPQYKNKYVKKVIDSFFTNFKQDNHNNQTTPIRQIIKNYQNPQNIKRSKLINFRGRMKQWKRKNNFTTDISYIDTNQFIRSSPKKSIFSDFDQEKSMEIGQEKNISQLKDQMSNQLSNNFQENQSNMTFSRSSIYRPLSQHHKKRSNKNQINKNTNASVTVSVFFNESNSPRQKMRKQIRKLVQQNEYYQQFNVYQQNKLKSRIRKYINQNNPLYLREDKINKKNIKTLWKYSKFPLTLQYPLIKSIKQQLSQQFIFGDNQIDSYKQIYTKSYYHSLFINHNQELIDIIKSMAKFIINCNGKILTNAFHLNNIYKVNQKQFYLKDLGSSAVSQSFKIRQRTISHLYPPILKQQNSTQKWLIRPEYMSPQLIQGYKNLDYSWIQNSPQTVMASEVWSLGCMILQLLTLIPLNQDIRSRLKSNPQNIRRGFLSINFKQNHIDFDLLQRKQKYLQTILNRKIQAQLRNIPVHKKVLQILKKMLIFETKKRIKPQKILQQLNF